MKRMVCGLAIGAMTAPIRLYQLLISPILPASCRFYPSCSHYAVEALRVHGAPRGLWLSVRRLSRCHPWSAGGVDPVPPPASDPKRRRSEAEDMQTAP